MSLRVSDLSPALRQKFGLDQIQAKTNKYHAQKKQLDGFTFDSTKEARVYVELTHRQRIGEIENLQCQPQMYGTHEGRVTFRYTADFRFRNRQTGQWEVWDIKGGSATKTEAYRLRKKLIEIQYGIEIHEG